MKLLKISLLVILVTSVFSCRKKDLTDNNDPINPNDTSTVSQLDLKFTTSYGDDLIVKNQEIYSNYYGAKFSFTTMAYYLSQITLVAEDGSEYNTEIYKLVNAFDENFQKRSVTVPNNKYTKVKFYFGVPEPENSTAHYEGDLNISHGMSWNWNFGYIFSKHEGYFSQDTIVNSPISYHLGTKRALQTVELPIDLYLTGTTTKLNINLDVKKIYNNPDILSFAEDGLIHSTEASDASWISEYSGIIANSFDIK